MAAIGNLVTEADLDAMKRRGWSERASEPRPSEGRILIDGVQLRKPSRRTGILLQKDHLFEWRTVLQNA